MTSTGIEGEPRAVVERWYASLSAMDMKTYAATMHDDIVVNVVGRTAVSGRWRGKKTLMEVVLPMVVANLDASTINLSRHFRIMAVDGPIVVGLMEGGARTKDGAEYDQQYCQVFRVEDGLIVEAWEFFDTVQAEARLFGKPIDPGEKVADRLAF